jgi:hypothetical protein
MNKKILKLVARLELDLEWSNRPPANPSDPSATAKWIYTTWILEFFRLTNQQFPIRHLLLVRCDRQPHPFLAILHRPLDGHVPTVRSSIR